MSTCRLSLTKQVHSERNDMHYNIKQNYEGRFASATGLNLVIHPIINLIQGKEISWYLYIFIGTDSPSLQRLSSIFTIFESDAIRLEQNPGTKWDRDKDVIIILDLWKKWFPLLSSKQKWKGTRERSSDPPHGDAPGN